MRILRNAHCPRTVLRVYAQHLSAGRSGLSFPSSGHAWSGRRRGVVLDVYGRIGFEKGECVDVLNLRPGLATSPGGQTRSGENGWLGWCGARADLGVVGTL
jgi:hypothetical protein